MNDEKTCLKGGKIMPSTRANAKCILGCLAICLDPTPVGEWTGVLPVSAAIPIG